MKTITVDVPLLDRLVEFCDAEIAQLRQRYPDLPRWVDGKIDRLNQMRAALGELRRSKQMSGMSGKSIEGQDLEKRLRSTEGLIRQVSLDTFGREMTPEEYAKAASYEL